MGHTPARKGVAQRSCHRLLTDHLIEALRAPFTSKDLIRHGTGSNLKVESEK
jgi:hypothetical protein